VTRPTGWRASWLRTLRVRLHVAPFNSANRFEDAWDATCPYLASWVFVGPVPEPFARVLQNWTGLQETMDSTASVVQIVRFQSVGSVVESRRGGNPWRE